MCKNVSKSSKHPLLPFTEIHRETFKTLKVKRGSILEAVFKTTLNTLLIHTTITTTKLDTHRQGDLLSSTTVHVPCQVTRVTVKKKKIMFWRWWQSYFIVLQSPCYKLLYQHPKAAATNHHKLRGLKPQKPISWFWRWEVRDQNVRRTSLPLKALDGDFPAPPSFLGHQGLLSS